jgi:hypothetical protein
VDRRARRCRHDGAYASACGVRPPAEPVPRTLVGTPAGALYAELVRFTDGQAHAARKHALPPLDLSHVADACAGGLAGLPIRALAGRTDVVPWVYDLARCFAHPDDEEPRGSIAATRLLEVFPDANTIGLLVQSSEATTDLIGNTLVALAAGRTESIPDLVQWVVRYDPPIHNTRRYAVADITIADQHIRAGETMLAVLAAANRDPAAHAPFTFGIGPHACPGAQIATTIATAAVEALLDNGLNPARVATGVTYRPLPNARIPILHGIE